MDNYISNNTVKLAAWFAIIWFVFTIDACFTWFMSVDIRILVGSIFLFVATLMPGVTTVSLNRIFNSISVPVFFLAGYMLFVKMNIFSPFKYFPLICLLFWNKKVIEKFYQYFRNFIVFYAVVSVFVEALFLSGLWKSLPYIIMPPQDTVQEQLNIVNYVYGFFCIPVDNFSSLYRACGPLREGGHFSVYLGFLYFAEKVIYNKRSIWVIIAGLLTLSPNFLFFLIISEVYNSISRKDFLKPAIAVSSIVLVAIVAFKYSPRFIQKEVNRIILERSLQESIENSRSEGFMAFLDVRTGEVGRLTYDNFVHKDFSDQLVGLKSFDEDFVMSDYRYSIMLHGYIGFILILWCTWAFSRGRERNMFGVVLLLFTIYIFLQRAWMFNQVYIWTMMLLIGNMKDIEYNRQKLCLNP